MNTKLSAHIGYLFGEVAVIDRIEAASKAGFDLVEHPNPLTVDPAVMARRLSETGMGFTQIGAAGGDPERREKGLAALPDRRDEFRDALCRAIDYAEAIGCPLVHPMAGVVHGDLRQAEETYRANLDYAVEQCRGRPVSILIEAISETAVPGYFLSRLDQAVELADEVAPRDISLLTDTFHAAANNINLAAFVRSHIACIGHVQIADFPGRHEPGSGRLDFAGLLTALSDSGYRGAIGFEYIASRVTQQTLGWLPSWRRLLGEMTSEGTARLDGSGGNVQT